MWNASPINKWICQYNIVFPYFQLVFMLFIFNILILFQSFYCLEWNILLKEVLYLIFDTFFYYFIIPTNELIHLFINLLLMLTNELIHLFINLLLMFFFSVDLIIAYCFWNLQGHSFLQGWNPHFSEGTPLFLKQI